MATHAQQSSASLPAFSSVFGAKVATIEVGPHRKKYYIHEALLAHYSEYFRKALRGPWKEAEEGVVRLEDVDHRAFNLLVEWIYTQKLPADEDSAAWMRLLEEATEKYRQKRYEVLVRAYVLGDRLLIDRFRRLVNNRFTGSQGTDYFAEPARFETFTYAFNNIPADRPMLQFMVDDHCDIWPELKDDYGDGNPEQNAILKSFNELPKAFLMRAMRRMSDFRYGRPNGHGFECYHEHESDEEKEYCGAFHMKYDKVLDYGSFE